jgi:hypothetical protein
LVKKYKYLRMEEVHTKVISESLTPVPLAAPKSKKSKAKDGGRQRRHREAAVVGLLANASKRKDGFAQLFLMVGVFMMVQKHRLRNLTNVNADLCCERDHLSSRMRDLQDAMHDEADVNKSGAFTSHLRHIFTAHTAPAVAVEN